MSRPLRIEYPDAWYHVMNRGQSHQTIYHNDSHRQQFLILVGDISQIYDVECHAYCLLDNHYHLLLKTPRANLGRAMRHINGLYTQYYNRDQKKDGPLFRGRYKAIIIDADQYLLQVSRYIHRNPLEAKMVKQLQRYHWSSYRAYTGNESGQEWLHQEQTLAMVGQRQVRRRYGKYVETECDNELNEFYTAARQSPVLGDKAFQAKIKSRLGPEIDGQEISALKNIQSRPTMDNIIKIGAETYQIEERMLYWDGRKGEGEAKSVTMTLCREIGGYSLKEIGDRFKLSYMGVSAALRRVKDKKKRNKAFKGRIDKIISLF